MESGRISLKNSIKEFALKEFPFKLLFNHNSVTQCVLNKTVRCGDYTKVLALRIEGNRLLSDWFCAVRLGKNSPFSLTEFTDGQALRWEKICLW